MEPTWTITELAELAATALADEPVRVNGRVRDVPNERLVRWYTTIGLLDPPASRRGRTALYGPRHLLQLVAVKRRQAAGRTIAEIQAELTGATDDTLQSIALLPRSVVNISPESSAKTPSVRGRFWADAPAPARGLAAHVGLDHGAIAGDARERDAPASRAALPMVIPGIRLAPDATLLLDADVAALTTEDLAAIEAAARPLVDELRRRGLSAPPPTPNPSGR